MLNVLVRYLANVFGGLVIVRRSGWLVVRESVKMDLVQ